MQYDTQWTQQERARVEALRLLIPKLSFPAADTPGMLGTQIADAVEPVAEFISGPEAKHPYPWDQAKEAHGRLTALLTADGSRNEWSAPDEFEVPAAELRAIRALLTENPPF